MEFTYKGLSAVLEKHTVDAQEVERSLQRLVQQNPRIEVVTDRPAGVGDELVLDYAGFCDGVQFEGGTAERQTLVLGSGAFIPGFEEQLVGARPGQTVTVAVTFPKEYHAENLKGKPAQFQCKVHEIRVKTPREADDAFAKEVGGCESLTQMREKIRADLQEYSDERGEMDLQDRLLRQAAQTLPFSVSDEELTAAVEEQLGNLNAQLAQQGLTMEMYCKFMKTTPEALREDARPAALAAMRNLAAVDRITELEHLTATPEEIEQTKQAVCRQNHITMDELNAVYDEELQKRIVKSVLTGKVMRLIRDAATVTER